MHDPALELINSCCLPFCSYPAIIPPGGMLLLRDGLAWPCVGAKVIANGYLDVDSAVGMVPKLTAAKVPTPAPSKTTVVGPGAGAEGAACAHHVTFSQWAYTFAEHAVIVLAAVHEPLTGLPNAAVPTTAKPSPDCPCTGGLAAAPGPDVAVSIETSQPPLAAAPAPSLPISAQALASQLLDSLVTSSPPPAPALSLTPPVPAAAPLAQPPGLHVSQTLSFGTPTAQETPSCICQSQGADRPVPQSPVQQGRRLLSDSNSGSSSSSGASGRHHRRRHSSTGRQLLRS